MSALASLSGSGPVRGLASVLAVLFRIPDPGEPTDYPPGSAGKIAVMIARGTRREPVFHPLDNREQKGSAPADESLQRRDMKSHTRELPRGISVRLRKFAEPKFRVRPYVPGRGRVQVGEYKTLQEAVRALRDFYRRAA